MAARILGAVGACPGDLLRRRATSRPGHGRPGRRATRGRRGARAGRRGTSTPPHATSSGWWTTGPSQSASNAWQTCRVLGSSYLRENSGAEVDACHAELLGDLAGRGGRRLLAVPHAAGGEAVVHPGEDVLGVRAAVHVDPSRRVADQDGDHDVPEVVAAHGRAGRRADDPTRRCRRSRPARRSPVPRARPHPAVWQPPRRLARVSVRRVMGTETEYGIIVPGNPGANAMLISSQIVNAYAQPSRGAQPAAALGLRGGEPAAGRARVRPRARGRRRRPS